MYWGCNPLNYYEEDYDDEIEEGEEWKYSDEENTNASIVSFPYTKDSRSVLIQYTDNKWLFNKFNDIINNFNDDYFSFDLDSRNIATISEYEFLEIRRKLRKKPNRRNILKNVLHMIKTDKDIHIDMIPLSQNQKFKHRS